MPAPLDQSPFSAFAFVSLGSNLGDSTLTVAKAMQELEVFSDRPVLRSSLWRSDPIDCPPGSAPFVNAVAGFIPRPSDDPVSLLASLQRLEAMFGRKPKIILNEPRPLDLDLISYGTRSCAGPKLILPHPRAHLRRFVLQPLAEIAPTLRLPGQLGTVQQLLENLASDQPMVRIGGSDLRSGLL